MKGHDLSELKPGDLGFTQIPGWTGFWVTLGQALIGDASRYTHVFMVVDEDHLIEAMPSGARIEPLLREYDTEVMYVRMNIHEGIRDDLCKYARSLVGTPYSFVDYLSLALHHWGIRPKFIERYVANSKRMICSQLVDHILTKCGRPVFDDGRLSQDVTPGDMFYETTARIIGFQSPVEPPESHPTDLIS